MAEISPRYKRGLERGFVNTCSTCTLYNLDDSLRTEHLNNLKEIIKAADEKGMVAFLYNASYYTRTKEPVARENEALLHTHSGILQMLWNVGMKDKK